MTTEHKQHSEQIARRFHEAYERLAPSYGYETRSESAVPWESVPLMNKRLMVATVEEACGGLFEQYEDARRLITGEIADTIETLTSERDGLNEQFDACRGEAEAIIRRVNANSIVASDEPRPSEVWISRWGNSNPAKRPSDG